MHAEVHVSAELSDSGASRLVRLAGAPPLVVRPTGPHRVHLVGAAAGPLGGDQTVLQLQVGPGAVLVVAQAAATVALPGPGSGRLWSQHRIEATVADGGVLVLAGTPLVAAAGSRHRVHAEVELGAGARLVWRDLVVPGRSGEGSGRLQSRLRVTQVGTVVLDHQLELGRPDSGWQGTAVLAGARCVGSLAVLGLAAALPAGRDYGTNAVLMALATPGALLGTALGAAHEVGRTITEMAADVLAQDPALAPLAAQLQ